MNNLLKVAVFHTGNDLVKKVSSFVRTETSFADDIVEEFSSGNLLVDEKDICWCINNFVKTDDVWMGTEMQNIDFTLDLFFHSKLLDLCLVQDLDRNFVPRDNMCG